MHTQHNKDRWPVVNRWGQILRKKREGATGISVCGAYLRSVAVELIFTFNKCTFANPKLMLLTLSDKNMFMIVKIDN